MGIAEYNAALDELDRRHSTGLAVTRSLSLAAEKNPDEEARAQDLSRRTGLPADWIPEFKGEASRRSLLRSPAVQSLGDHPQTAAFLSDRNNAAVAHDDVAGLSLTERIIRELGVGLSEGSVAGKIVRLNREAGIIPGIEGVISDPTLTPAPPAPLTPEPKGLLGKAARGVGAIVGDLPLMMTGGAGMRATIGASEVTAASPWVIRAATRALTTGAEFATPAAIHPWLDRPTYESPIDTAQKSLESATLQGYVGAAMALSGMAGSAAGKLGGARSERILSKLFRPDAAVDVAAGLGRTATQKAADTLLAPTAEVLGMTGASAGLEGKPFSAEDLALNAATIGLLKTGHAVLGIPGFAGDVVRARDAIRNQEAMLALGEASKDSKLRARLPEKYREFVEAATKDGPVENVFIPVEEWKTFWQSKGMDPQATAREVLADPRQYQEAKASGSDLVIPLGTYAEKLAGTPYHAELSRDLRLHPGDMTPREAEAFRKDVGSRMDELVKESEKAPESESDQKVYDDVVAQLVAAGRAPDAAAKEATLTQAVMRTLGKRSGVDPYELYQRYGLKITASPTAPEIEGVPAGTTFSQAAKPPEGFPAELNGWTYDGTYEGTGVHQYTDRNPISPTYRDTIAVKAPEQLAGKIEGIRKLREIGQPGRPGEPLVSLTGKELGEFGEDKKALRDAAVAWYRDNLQGTFVEREDLGKIRFSGKGRKEFGFYGADPDKLRMVVALKDLVENGDYIRREELNKPRRDKIVAFHVIEGDVDLSGKTQRARVLVAEDRDGNLFYQLLPDAAEADAIKASRGVPGAKSRPDTTPEGGETTLDQSVPQPGPEINLQILPQGEKGKRGYLRFGTDRKFEIGLLENADLSTYLHESGHFYLEVLRDLSGKEGADPGLKADWETMAKHLGIDALEPSAAIPKESHETFARSFEAYLMEGKAPSPALASVFQRFKAWLVQVYKEVSRLDVRLNDDVRGVFDRLVATDEEIAAAESAQRRAPIFATAEDAGMTEAEFKVYRGDVQKAHDVARDRLERELISEFTRERKGLWKQERERMRAVVEEEANRDPVFQVYNLLTRGELLDGSEPAEPVKMSRKAFVEAYGKEYVDKLPPKWFRRMTAKEGMHPDVVAEMFGFSSGDEMIKKLLESPMRKDWIEAETDRRMKEAHGDLLNDGGIAEAAIAAVHNDETGQLLRAELRALRRKEAQVWPFVDQALRASEAQQRDLRREMEASIPPLAAFRLAAEKAIGAKSLMSTRPDLYLRAEEKAARQAFDAAAKGDFEKAAEAKKKQLLNHYLFLEADKAREEGDSIYRYVQGLTDTPAQERLGKAGEDFLEQINGILEQYEFKQVTNRAIEQRKSLLEWVRLQEEMGVETAIPDVILYNARTVNYRELTMDQLRSVRDALKNIEHLARMKNRLLGKQAEVSFGEAVNAMVVSIHNNIGAGKPLPIDRETRSVIERLGDKASEFDVSLLKAEQFVEWADGKDITGPWSEYIFRPISDAQVLEGDLTERYTKHLTEMFEEYTRDVGAKAMMEKIYIKSLDQSLTRQAIVAAALNTGNETSLDKLLRGRGWTEDHLQEVLSHLDAKDWQFVQKTWDAIDQLWPDIASLQRRLTGLEPKKVVAREFTNEHGTFQGGYYPAVYDSRFSQAGAKQADVTGDRLFESNYVRATTDKGHTKERTAYVAPVLLSLEVIPQHFAQVIHDLAFREAVVQADRLLKHADVRTSINETMGLAYHRMLNLWLASVANDRNVARTGTEFYNRFMDGLRMNATVVAMGFKVTTVIGQALDIIQSFRRVEGKYLGPAILQFTKNPIASRDWVQEKSGEMRHRERNLDRDLRDLGRKIMGKEGVLPWMQEKALQGIGIVDMVAAVPTWIGAYNQALAKGLGDADAIAWADRQVRLSNPAGGAKDLAAIQRSGSLMKLFTMFYSYFNVLYNQQRDMAMQWKQGEKGWKDVGMLAFDSLAVVVVPALAGELLVGRGPDDDENPAAWAIRKVLTYPFISVPILKDIVNSLESGRDYQMTPVADAIARMTKAAARSEQVAEGEKEPVDLAAPLADVAGYSLGLPSGQAKITGRYIWDLMEGNESPAGPGEFMRNMMFTRKKK